MSDIGQDWLTQHKKIRKIFAQIYGIKSFLGGIECDERIQQIYAQYTDGAKKMYTHFKKGKKLH